MKSSRWVLLAAAGLFFAVLSGVVFGQWQDVRLTRNLYIIFDGSGSMRSSKCSDSQSKIDVAKQAFSLFLTTIPDDMNCGLYVFDSGGMREVEPLQKINRERLLATVNAIEAGGSTPLTESIEAARKALLAQKERQLGYGEYTMLIITDGEANNVSTLPSEVKPSTDAGIVVQVIGFCLDSSHSLKQLAHIYREANSPQELQKALTEVLAEAETFPDPGEFDATLIDQLGSPPQDSVGPDSDAPEKNSSGTGFPLVMALLTVFIVIFAVKRRGKQGKR